MNLYKKRIAFCLSDQHTIPHGGLGQFAKSFVETFTPLGYKIDIITDKPTSNLEFKEYSTDFYKDNNYAFYNSIYENI